MIEDSTAVETVEDADTLLTALDAAISQVSGYRSRLGASENQLGHAIAGQQSALEQLTLAESHIRDADLAAEATRMAQLETQHEALIALLSQLNTNSKTVLPSARWRVSSSATSLATDATRWPEGEGRTVNERG